MSDTQILTVVLSTTSTFIVVLVGLFLSSRQIDSVRNEMGAIRNELRAEIRAVETKVDMMNELLRAVMGKLDDMDTRLAHIERGG